MQISDEMKALEALARAYDHEEAACMGEPSPWVSADSEGDDEWKAERIVAARAGLDAYRSALSLPVQPVAWPGGFFKLGGDNRLRECASDGCHQHVSIRVERSGVGSDHCEPCARKIADLLTTPPVPPTKGPEDDLIAALEKRAKWHKCSCPEPCDDYGVFPGGCAGLYREDYLSLLALRSRPASALPVVGDLKWDETEPSWHTTTTPFGCGYEVRISEKGTVRYRRTGRMFETFDGTFEAAKAAAQADFEARILAALTPSVQP